MGEVTNGTIDSAHYGPIGDAARNIASYCDGSARVHVYTAAFDALTTAQAEIEALRARVADALAWLRDHIKEVDDDNSYWGGPHKRAYLGAPAILKELTARVALTKEPDA